MIQNTLQKRLLGEIVAEDFRSAAVFREVGIDFCCGGKKTLEQVCNEKKLNPAMVVNRLREIETQPSDPGKNFKEWALDFLCDYIVNVHHKYIKKAMPELVFYTQKIAAVHGAHHPELSEVADLVGKINHALLQHLQKEEEILFPAIKAVLRGDAPEETAIIHSEIERMSGEHEFAGGAMDIINQLTRQYLVPDDGCQTYQLTFTLLQQFEDDLHIHVHLENNILFKKAMQL